MHSLKPVWRYWARSCDTGPHVCRLNKRVICRARDAVRLNNNNNIIINNNNNNPNNNNNNNHNNYNNNNNNYNNNNSNNPTTRDIYSQGRGLGTFEAGVAA